MISVYNKLNLTPGPVFPRYDIGYDKLGMISFKGYIIMNTLWKRKERYNYNYHYGFVEVVKGQAFVTELCL